MSLTATLLMALIPLVVVPPLIWFRQRLYNKRSAYVSAQCSQCGTYNELEKLQNYTCKSCQTHHHFLDEAGKPLPQVERYECQYCGAENIKGILTCTACGSANRRGIPEIG